MAETATINLDDQPKILLVIDGKEQEFLADDFLLAAHVEGLDQAELDSKDQAQLIVKIVEQVTGAKVGYRKAIEIYGHVGRMTRDLQGKSEQKPASGTTTESTPQSSAA